MSNNLNLARLSNILADIKSRRDSDIASKVSETVFATHVNDDVSHITSGERTAWNSKAEGTHTHTSTDIPELMDLISTTTTNYNDLSAEIANHTTQIASLGSDISDINDAIYDINLTIAGHTDELAALTTQVAENQAIIAALVADTEEIDETTINNLLTAVFGEYTPDENEVWIAPANWDNLYLNYWDDAPGQFDEPNSEPIVTTVELIKNDQGYYVWDVTDPIFSSDSELFSFKFTTNDGVATAELKVLPSIKSALGGKIVTVYPNSNTIDILLNRRNSNG